MKKFFLKFIFILFLFSLSLLPVFSEGTIETTNFLLQQIPDLINQQYNTQIATVSNTASSDIDRNMSMLTRLYKYLEDNYLWEIDHDKAYEAMATALFDSLGDKYTYYVTSEKSAEYMEDTMGKYGGLGFYFSKTYLEYQDEEKPETLFCNISQVFPNSPASKGGILAGDFITHINGESVIPLSADECASRMKGLIGSTVEITIQRSGVSFTLTLAREQINVPSIVSEYIEDYKIGYIQILQFYSQTTTSILDSIKTFETQGMQALLLDLRNCPGGDVDAALAIANLFISDAELLNVYYKNPTKNTTFTASKGVSVSSSLPIAILVNENTASSSEILSSTMKDNKRAVLIGTTTYGKGIMQAVSSFGTGDISVTIASFVPPSGKEIHNIGVEPDIVVETPKLKEEENQAYLNLLSSSELTDFIKEYPDYSKENVLLFAETHPYTGLSDDILHLVVRNKYYSEMTYDEQPKVDIYFDIQVTTAIDYLLNLI